MSSVFRCPVCRIGQVRIEIVPAIRYPAATRMDRS
jgi:hypothetical protein